MDRQYNCKAKRGKLRSTKHYTETKDRLTPNQLKSGRYSGVLEGLAVPTSPVAHVVLLLLQIRWQVMNFITLFCLSNSLLINTSVDI